MAYSFCTMSYPDDLSTGDDDFLEKLSPGLREEMMEAGGMSKGVAGDLIMMRASRALTQDDQELQQLLIQDPTLEGRAASGDLEAVAQLQEINTRIAELQDAIQTHQLILSVMKEGQ